jgi:hypothetical protein
MLLAECVPACNVAAARKRKGGVMRRPLVIAGTALAGLLLSSCVNFRPPVTGSVGTGPTVDTGEIAAGDVNGDGWSDALVMNNDGQLWWLARCDIIDSCLPAIDSVTPPAGVHDLATGDVDEDGIDDVVAAGDGGVQVFMGHDREELPPQGGPSQADMVTVTASARKRVVVADLDHNGDLDVGVITDVAYEYYPGDGAGHFGAAVPVYTIPSLFTGVLNELVVADVDGNGWQEAIWAGWFFATGGGIQHAFAGFEGVTLTLGYFSPHQLVGPIGVCDLDNDGRADLAQRRESTNDIRLLRSVPDATYGNSYTGFGPGGALTDVAAPNGTNTIRMRDLDANGKCDVVVGRQGGISWWNGNGNGTFLTVNGISRLDRDIPDVKGLELSLDAGAVKPDLFVSQGQPDGRVSWVPNQSTP